MPTMPTGPNLDTANYNRLVATFPGATTEEKVAAYNAWIVNRWIERVEISERLKLEQQFNTQRKAAEDALAASLPQKVEEPRIV